MCAKQNLKNILSFIIFTTSSITGIILIATIIFLAKNVRAAQQTPATKIKTAQYDAIYQKIENLPSDPSILKIPAINITAKIQYVGLKKNGEIGTPTNHYDVAWLKSGPKPGEIGNAIISGHYDTKNSPNGVFKNISKLKPEDIIEITDKHNKKFTFQVERLEIFGYKDTPNSVFGKTNDRNLNLITCAGKWLKEEKSYDKRLVIFAKLIK